MCLRLNIEWVCLKLIFLNEMLIKIQLKNNANLNDSAKLHYILSNADIKYLRLFDPVFICSGHKSHLFFSCLLDLGQDHVAFENKNELKTNSMLAILLHALIVKTYFLS